MKWTTLTAFAVFTLLATVTLAPAQIDYEPFPKLGSPIPGWTHHVAKWTVKQAATLDYRAESTGTAGHSYLSRTSSAAIGGMIEAKLTGITNTCNGGVVMKLDATLTTLDGVRAYGASSGGMSSYLILILQGPGVSYRSVSIGTRTKDLRVRLYTWGVRCRAMFDVHPLDGKWDYELNSTGVSSGAKPYGAYAWHGSQADDVKFFDAVIWRRSAFGQGNLGTTVQLDLRAPSAGRPYALVVSFTKSMIPVPGFPPGWLLPIFPDTLTSTAPKLPTIFGGLTGNLDTSGGATAKINVPKVAALAGVTLHVTGVVHDGRASITYLHLFNDERIDLIP